MAAACFQLSCSAACSAAPVDGAAGATAASVDTIQVIGSAASAAEIQAEGAHQATGDHMTQERALKELVEKLRKAHGNSIVSVVLYGSAAIGDQQAGFSDLNILCVLTRVTRHELAASEGVFQWWRKLGNPAPLLMDRNEVARAADCFPIEFHDIKERRQLLDGTDVMEIIEIHDTYYRAQVEHELRAKLLRLRQKAAGVLSDKDLLLSLMADSISTFAVLIRHALRLAGANTIWQKRQIFESAGETFGIDPTPFGRILDFRDTKARPKNLEPAILFDEYLEQLCKLVSAVDRLHDVEPESHSS